MFAVQKVKESIVERAFVHACKVRGLEQRKVRWIGRRAAPDRVIFIDGGIYVELKRPGERLRASQDMERAKMLAGGMKFYVLTSVEEVGRFFRDLVDKLNRDTL